MQHIHVLETQSMAQKFFKPASDDFIFFLDDGVTCPASNNPFVTDQGHVLVSAICFDCKSFKGFFRGDHNQKSIFCEGSFELVVDKAPSIRDYLEPVEQTPEVFWTQKAQSA